MRIGLGAGASLSTLAALAAVAFALFALAASPPASAQSKGGRAARPKPKPAPAVVVDAGAADAPPSPDEGAAGPTLGGSATADAGALAPATTPSPGLAPAPAVSDGGVRLSPLNPAPNELAGASPPPAGAPGVDYDTLLGDIAALRARVAAVGDALYQSRLAVTVRTEGDHGKIARLVVGLDDGAVFTAPATFRAEDPATVYDHAVAPGKHAVTIDVERKDDRDEAFRTSQRSRFVVDVPKDHRLEVEVRIADDSSMAGDFPSDRSGQYDLRIRARATARPVKR